MDSASWRGLPTAHVHHPLALCYSVLVDVSSALQSRLPPRLVAMLCCGACTLPTVVGLKCPRCPSGPTTEAYSQTLPEGRHSCCTAGFLEACFSKYCCGREGREDEPMHNASACDLLFLSVMVMGPLRCTRLILPVVSRFSQRRSLSSLTATTVKPQTAHYINNGGSH